MIILDSNCFPNIPYLCIIFFFRFFFFLESLYKPFLDSDICFLFYFSGIFWGDFSISLHLDFIIWNMIIFFCIGLEFFCFLIIKIFFFLFCFCFVLFLPFLMVFIFCFWIFFFCFFYFFFLFFLFIPTESSGFIFPFQNSWGFNLCIIFFLLLLLDLLCICI